MEIPLVLFLYVYLAVVLLIVVFSLLNLYHIVRFGKHALVSYSMSIVYAIGVVVILLTTWAVLSSTDWSSAVTLSIPSFGVEETAP